MRGSDAEALVLRVVDEGQAQVDVSGAGGGPVLAAARAPAAVRARQLHRAAEEVHERARHRQPEPVPARAALLSGEWQCWSASGTR